MSVNPQMSVVALEHLAEPILLKEPEYPRSDPRGGGILGQEAGCTGRARICWHWSWDHVGFGRAHCRRLAVPEGLGKELVLPLHQQHSS